MSYETYLQDQRQRSTILSGPTDGDRLHAAAIDLSTRERVQALLSEYEASEGHIEAAESAVSAIEQEHTKLRTQRSALGWPDDGAMPSEMADRYRRAKAKLDVLRHERDRLRQLLDQWQETEEQDRSADILKKIGNLSITTDRDSQIGFRTAVDGQRLSLVDADGRILDKQFNPRSTEALAAIPQDSFAIIDDAASPYDGMDMGSYRQIVSYIKARREERKKALLAENAARPVDERLPESQLVDRARRWRTSPWPPEWPPDARNWKAQQREEA